MHSSHTPFHSFFIIVLHFYHPPSNSPPLIFKYSSPPFLSLYNKSSPSLFLHLFLSFSLPHSLSYLTLFFLYRSGALQIGDRILSINGTVTDRLTHSEAVALLENAGNVVNLEIAFDALPEGKYWRLIK